MNALQHLCGQLLLADLPKDDADPLPDLTDAVLLTHLRTEAAIFETSLSLTEGSDAAGAALPGAGVGKAFGDLKDSITALIDALNERYGMNLGEADKVWMVQQKQAALADPDMRIRALNNDRDAYRVVLDQKLEDIDRHAANGELFNAFFARPGMRDLGPTRKWPTDDDARAISPCRR